ncbi:MAG: dTDP-4-dehydrorhamnose 3,5-epimerase [Candidatus Eremiobacteraeota bacterium]|nr:dTDP-4-dehydrorhamnose 3,5-epimerase [Candidatus Eremiobacteraeota bacterium]
MHVEQLPLAGALALTLPAFADDRGYFKETYSSARYRAAGVTDDFVQDNVSYSRRNVLRGLHGAWGMSKLVGVLAGEAFDVIVDVRRDSPTSGRWYGERLRAGEHRQLYVPAGCLHGFLALTDDVLFLYKQSALYDPSAEFGIRFDDPDLAVAWPLDGGQAILSAKDAANPTARSLGLV